MARRDLSGAVDFGVLDRMTGDDDAVAEEVPVETIIDAVVASVQTP